MKRYAKKREPVCAAQWTGALTTEMQELLADRESRVDGNQLVFSNAKGPGRCASVGDWICSASGEDLTLVDDDAFRARFEEVDETGRPLPPTDDEHEANAQLLLRELDVLLLAGLKLSREDHPTIFGARDRLARSLRRLLEDEAYAAARDERRRIRDRITKELTP